MLIYLFCNVIFNKQTSNSYSYVCLIRRGGHLALGNNKLLYFAVISSRTVILIAVEVLLLRICLTIRDKGNEIMDFIILKCHAASPFLSPPPKAYLPHRKDFIRRIESNNNK